MKSEINKIKILGGCGFLGLHTAKLLTTKNYSVSIVDLPIKKGLCPKNVEFLGLENSAKKCRIEQNVEQNVELLWTNQGMNFKMFFELSRPILSVRFL